MLAVFKRCGLIGVEVEMIWAQRYTPVTPSRRRQRQEDCYNYEKGKDRSEVDLNFTIHGGWAFPWFLIAAICCFILKVSFSAMQESVEVLL